MSHVFQKSDALEHLEKTLCKNMLTGIQKYIYASVVKLHFFILTLGEADAISQI